MSFRFIKAVNYSFSTVRVNRPVGTRVDEEDTGTCFSIKGILPVYQIMHSIFLDFCVTYFTRVALRCKSRIEQVIKRWNVHRSSAR